MNNDRKSHRTAMAIFSVILAVAMIAAFITTIEGVETKQASNVAQPGTTGLAPIRRSIERRESLFEISSARPVCFHLNG
jgi:hypothetical protein